MRGEGFGLQNERKLINVRHMLDGRRNVLDCRHRQLCGIVDTYRSFSERLQFRIDVCGCIKAQNHPGHKYLRSFHYCKFFC